MGIVMEEYTQVELLNALVERGILFGIWDPVKAGGLEPGWFCARQVDMLDMRGDLQIRSGGDLNFGRHIKIITAAHAFKGDSVDGNMLPKKCWIDHNVSVFSYVILYNCHLGHHSVVSLGSVVNGLIVPPYCMVEGNPARIVREYRDGRWRHTENCQE